jgi:uncharacterized coiled-coil protein SlyX
MKKLSLIPLALAAVLIVAPIAEAKKPTTRARIHALEKRLVVQSAEVRDLRELVGEQRRIMLSMQRSIEDAQRQADAARLSVAGAYQAINHLLDCLLRLPSCPTPLP